MPLINVNDIGIYYEIHGAGEPLVLLPGWGTEITTVSGLIVDFAREHQVIAIDNRGAGRSGKPDTPYSIEMMADDTIGVLDALGIRRAHMFGISMGSMIAQMIAAKYPERVNGLILHVGFTRIPFLARAIMSVTQYLPGAKKKMEEGMAMILDQDYPPTPESFRRQGEAVARFDGREVIGRIRAPTLIVNGTKDQFVPVKISRELAAGIAGAKLVLVEGDHLFATTQREKLMEPALDFLATVDAAGANALIKPSA